MPTSDEELQKEQERLEDLRQQVREARATREQRERDQANDLSLAQVQAEAASLEAQLLQEKEMLKNAEARAEGDQNLVVAREEMERALAAQAAVTENAEAQRAAAEAAAAAAAAEAEASGSGEEQ